MRTEMSEAQSLSGKSFEPTSTQEAFLKCTEPQVLLSGGFGAGKSRVGCEKGYMMNLRYPGNRGLIVRKNFSDVRSSTIEQTLIEEVIPDDHIVDHNKSQHKIVHFTGEHDPNGAPVNSEIHYHGLSAGRSSQDDDLPRKIGGQQYAWIFVDEGVEITLGSWNQLQGRLRYNGREQGGVFYKVPFRQIFTATNPAGPSHWMYQKFYDDEQGQYYTMTAEELVSEVESIPRDYVERMKDDFSGVYYERYFEGKWVGAEGMVYEEFDRKTHKRPWDELPGDWTHEKETTWSTGGKSVWVRPPKDWKVYRSVDFGYRNPFVCQWWAVSPDKPRRYVLFREIYKTEELMEDLAQDIKQESRGLDLEQSYADPAQAEDKATLERHGVITKGAKKDISAGIQEVKSALAKRQDGIPNLVLMENSLIHPPDNTLDDAGKPVSTLEEITQYQWKDEKDEPVKKNDHGMDAMRYLIYTIEQGVTMTRDEMERMESIFNSGGAF